MNGPTGPQFLNELVEKLQQFAGQSPARDLEKNIRATLSAGLSRLDLVTREEFEIQQEVLLRTRDRLEALESRLAQLEARLARESDDAN